MTTTEGTERGPALVVVLAAEARKWWLRRREANEGVLAPTS
jgi:hypothetical protein